MEGRKRRSKCEYEYGEGLHDEYASTHHHQDYPFSPSSSHARGSTPATTLPIELHAENVDIKSDDLSVEIISEFQYNKQLLKGKDDEEVESCLSSHNTFTYVHGHRVRTEFAPLLREILEEHGDISRGNDVKSPQLLSRFLERICQCHAYQRLEQSKELSDLQGVVSELRFLERHKLRVGWLLERVEKDLEFVVLQQKKKKIKLWSTKAVQVGRNDENKQAGKGVRRSSRTRKAPGRNKDFLY